jgi:hypothetical protein
MELIGPEFGKAVRACSPIRIEAVKTQGARRLQMNFLHAAYPAGVQDKSYLIQTIQRDENYLLGKVLNADRMVLLFELDANWLNLHFSAGLERNASPVQWCEHHLG